MTLETSSIPASIASRLALRASLSACAARSRPPRLSTSALSCAALSPADDASGSRLLLPELGGDWAQAPPLTLSLAEE